MVIVGIKKKNKDKRKPSNTWAHIFQPTPPTNGNNWEVFRGFASWKWCYSMYAGCVVLANPTLHCFPVASCIPKPIHPHQDVSGHSGMLLDCNQHLLPSCAKPAPGRSSNTTLFPPAWISSMARVWEIPRAGSPLISTISSPTCCTCT